MQKLRNLPGFDAFWGVYPKRVGKFMARKAWGKIPWVEQHYLEVIEAVEAWKRTDQWSDPQFIPYPATFLNQRRWEDEVPQNVGTKNDRRITRTLDAARQVLESGRQMGGGSRRALPRGDERAGDSDLLRIPRK